MPLNLIKLRGCINIDRTMDWKIPVCAPGYYHCMLLDVYRNKTTFHLLYEVHCGQHGFVPAQTPLPSISSGGICTVL